MIKKVPYIINRDLNSINQHKIFSNHQYKEYNEDINNLDANSCVVVIDFKENIKIRGGPTEKNNCFYEKNPISLL